MIVKPKLKVFFSSSKIMHGLRLLAYNVFLDPVTISMSLTGMVTIRDLGIYYWSGTGLTLVQMLRVHSPDGSTFLREMTSWLPSWKCDVKSREKIRLGQSMRIYLQNNSAKFHPDPIWNNWALGFYEEQSVAPTTTRRTTTTRRWVAIWDQFTFQRRCGRVRGQLKVMQNVVC